MCRNRFLTGAAGKARKILDNAIDVGVACRRNNPTWVWATDNVGSEAASTAAK